ncbi:unnamed protein product [Symbiodinium sp. CCMP2592]|nr:unnamed protein product [Symbiodinium sp. CCMP2592]
MIVRWLLISAILSCLPSAERVAEQLFLHEVDSFLTRRHGARESEQEKQSKASLVAHGIQETADGARTDVKVGLPKCSDGLLHLDGRYEVKEEVFVQGPSCRVTGSAELVLSAPVRFQGSAVFAGQLSVKAVDALSSPCVAVKGNLTLERNARLSLAGCKNQNQKGQGGCLRVDSAAELRGHLLLRGCEVGPDHHGEGGGIHVGGSMRHWDTTIIDAAGCRAGFGGAIWAAEMVFSGGNLSITQSKAQHDGGAIWVGEMLMSGGDLSIVDSKTVEENGGAIWVVQMIMSGGNLTIQDSEAVRKDGGGIFVADRMVASGGNLTIQDSLACENGGAIHAPKVNVSGGVVTIIESRLKCGDQASSAGGCVYAAQSFAQSGGVVRLQGCEASRGGGIFSQNITIGEIATLSISDSKAEKGGGIFATWITNKAEQLYVSRSRAEIFGGCFYVAGVGRFAGTLLLTECEADATGGGIYAQIELVAQEIRCSRCKAPTSGCLELAYGHARLGNVTVATGSRLQSASSVLGSRANASITVGAVDCRDAPGCTLSVEHLNLTRLLCPQGESRQPLADGGEECKECPADEIRLLAPEEDARCTACPNMGNLTIDCTPTELKLPPGYMVDFDHTVANDLSGWYRCPNEMACRGGHFNASSIPGEPVQELVPMCEEGYRGPGCTSCIEGYARADADILRCIRCATWTGAPKKVVWYVGFFLLKNLALFASAVVSVEGSKGQRATSATLLNQAMSFAAVAGVTMSGAMQTATFKNDLDNAAQVALQMLALPASVAQGQGSRDAGSMSGQCLLQLLHTDSGIHYVHALMSLWPAMLVAGLAVMKGGWLAAVVGSNVFLPAFIAGFGKYLVYFRLRPESDEDQALSALHLDFLPPGPQMTSHVLLRIAAVLSAIVGFSALSVCSWIYAVRTRSPKEPRPHVAYLMQAYRPECAIWEVERLLRKVLLAMIAALLPVTLAPALQMEAVTLVLIASLVAHLYFWPYKEDAWNRAEIGLLIVSLTITGLTTCIIAIDRHWAKSTWLQRALVFLICSIAGDTWLICGSFTEAEGICIVMLLAFSLAYVEERRQRAEAKKAERLLSEPLGHGHMAVRWLLSTAISFHLLSAERLAEQQLLVEEADSFLTRRHAATEPEQQETGNGTRTDVKVLPKCSDGLLHLDGRYEVQKGEAVLLEGPSCRVTGRAELLLAEPLHFLGSAVFAGQLSVRGGNMRGACISVNGDLTLEPEARLSIERCKSFDSLHGGGIHVVGDAELLGGQLFLRNCEVHTGHSGVGGGMNVQGAMRSRNATIDAAGCFSTNRGGSIGAGNMTVSGGSVIIKESVSLDGGAISVLDTMAMNGGNLFMVDVAAQDRGGAIQARAMIVSGGNVVIKKSEAGVEIEGESGRGGGIHAATFKQSGGAVSLQGCKATRQGGGIFSTNITIEESATLSIRDSTASRGGGIFANWVTNKAKQLNVSNCSAEHRGGCFYLEGGGEFAAPLLLRDCEAGGMGGAIFAQGMLVTQQIHCSRCTAPIAGYLHFDHGRARMGDVMLDGGSRLLSASPIAAAGANANVTLGRVDCREVPGCTLAVEHLNLASLLCQRGESRQLLADGTGEECRACPAGEIRLVTPEEDARCTSCPKIGNLTIACTATELQLPPGYMVDFDRTSATDLSGWYRCPNEMACRGGHFNASSVPGEPAQELAPMCEEGYRGPGCTSCTEGYARADADILRCIRCATWTSAPKKVVWYVGFFLLKNLALFASAVMSVDEGSKGQRATSATLLNQAMSFAAVAGITMSGAMQTSTFKNDLSSAAQVALQMLSLPASAAQGQGSDAGSGDMSGQCLLQLLTMDSSIHYVHALMSLWPALLVACLAVMKGGWLAAVVGSNVFLPAFIAGFGKYLVAFRLRPESEEDRALGALHLDFLPPGPQMTSHVPLRVAAVLGAILGFSALSVCSWIYAVLTRSPEEPRPHVAYLMQAYRPECAIWEVERLMRKVLLALIAAILPVTLSPALQMEAVTLVLITSLVAHLYFWPYQAAAWNRAEIGLLIVGVTITGLTTCLIANDLHWAKSTLTQRALVFLICSVAGGICIFMLLAFSVAYMEERRQRTEAQKAEEACLADQLDPDSFLTRRHSAKQEAGPAAYGAQETSDGTPTDVKVLLPKCSDGVLHLDGRYEVGKEAVVLVEEPSCRVTGSAELLLSAPLRFQGNAIFGGRLSVRAAGDGQMNGACIAVERNLTLEPNAHLSLAGCKNQATKGNELYGGCLRVGGDAELLGGELLLRQCRAPATTFAWGGGMHVGGALQNWNATIDAAGCGARYGGAISAQKQVAISGGNVIIKQCQADAQGGAIYARILTVSGGSLTIDNSSVRKDGGAIRAVRMDISGGNLTITAAWADENGGCISTSDFKQSRGDVNLQGCKARREGGGIFSTNITIEESATLSIRDSAAERGGGFFARNWVTNKAKQLNVSNCAAESHGGCFHLGTGEFAAPLLLRKCKARGAGGAIYAEGRLVAEQIRCSHCNAPTSGCFHVESGRAKVGNLALDSGSRLLSASSLVGAGANAGVTLGRVDCQEAPGCTLAVEQLRLAQLLCRRGESRRSLAEGEGQECKECPAGEIRLVTTDQDARCTSCPEMGDVTITCTSTELKLPPGYMVDFDRTLANDLSGWYRCPNEMACRGGHFNASAIPDEPAQELLPMCEEGYRGPGCTSCIEGYTRADADILRCIRCATWTTAPKKVVWYVGFFLLKNLALFASAVVSVEGSKGQRATSATLLNQAMSFAAVAGVTMSGAIQTGTFRNDLDNAAQVALQMLALPASVAQGQGFFSDASSFSMSGQCLLQLLTMDSSIHYVHVLMSLWPALLVAGLAVMKGGWLAAVVGSNVFLPAFIAGFGKYLVAFRLRPESEEDRALGALHLDFLPPGPQMTSHVPLRVAAVLGAILGFSALSVCSWIYAVRTRSPEAPRPHVAYLIQAYRTECAIWEVERLMRKVLLALVAATLPVTLSPAASSFRTQGPSDGSRDFGSHRITGGAPLLPALPGRRLESSRDRAADREPHDHRPDYLPHRQRPALGEVDVDSARPGLLDLLHCRRNLHRHAARLLPGLRGGAAPEGRGKESGGSVSRNRPATSTVQRFAQRREAKVNGGRAGALTRERKHAFEPRWGSA